MRRGFTLIELLVVMGIIAVLVTVTSFTLLTSRRKVENRGTVEQVVADMRSQQSKAMVGQGSGASFGVHFNSGNYVLFTGSAFNASDPTNFVVTMDNSIQFTSTFSGGNVVFTPVSGEISNYLAGSDTITVLDATDNTFHILHVNKYGVVDSKT